MGPWEMSMGELQVVTMTGALRVPALVPLQLHLLRPAMGCHDSDHRAWRDMEGFETFFELATRGPGD